MGAVESTYEEATRCPKCGNPGEVRSKRPAPKDANLKPGTTIQHVYCTSQLCTWYNTAWLIQVNPDGSVPPPRNHTGKDKLFSRDPSADEMAKRVREAIDAQIALETEAGGHGEIRNPFRR